MPAFPKLKGIVAATFTPLHEDGTLNVKAVDAQVDHHVDRGVQGVFVGGTTGECHSLTLEERLLLARRWAEAVRGTDLRLIVHVGHHSLPEARVLAAEAQKLGVDGISSMAPGYFKPATVQDLADFCRAVAEAAPGVPFYYYDIPALTGVDLPMPEFLDRAVAEIPTMAGIKFTNPDLTSLQRCLRMAREGGLSVLFGMDESLMAGWLFGVDGAVGSTYNLVAPVAHRLLEHLDQGRLEEAREEQFCIIEFVRICSGHGYLQAAKAAMSFLGLECGPVRSPLRPLGAEQIEALREELGQAGFENWTV